MWSVIAKAVVGTVASSVTASAIGGVKRFSRLDSYHRSEAAKKATEAALKESIECTDYSLFWPFSNIVVGANAARKAYREEVEFAESLRPRRR